MKTLPPQHLREIDYSDMERQLRRLLARLIFGPLTDFIESQKQLAPVETLLNARDPLADALFSGRVHYADGVFSGEFNAAISRRLRGIGGKFYKHQGVYRMDPANVPAWIQTDARNFQFRAKHLHDELDRRLQDALDHVKHAVDINPVDATQTIGRIEKGFQKAARELELQPELSSGGKERLAREYSENMKLSIENFSRQSIYTLRATVDQNAREGYRVDRLASKIKDRYSVTTNKARFLARQETALYMAKYRESRFKDAGVTHYRWSTSHDERVRPAAGSHSSNNHRILDGRIFRYDKPPQVDSMTGRCANPGQDFNCRCVDIPILATAHERHQEVAA